MTERVNHPSHYNVGFEVIDLIEDLDLNFHVGNWLKYFCRYKYKGTPVEDLKKGLWYLRREKSRYYFTDGSDYKIPKRLLLTEYFAKSWELDSTEEVFSPFKHVMEYVATHNFGELEIAIYEMQALIDTVENLVGDKNE